MCIKKNKYTYLQLNENVQPQKNTSSVHIFLLAFSRLRINVLVVFLRHSLLLLRLSKHRLKSISFQDKFQLSEEKICKSEHRGFEYPDLENSAVFFPTLIYQCTWLKQSSVSASCTTKLGLFRSFYVMTYQLLWVIKCQSRHCKRRVVAVCKP